MIHLPTIQGIIERRALINYRVDPKRLAHLLPAPFRPKIIHGMGIVGICLIRFRAIRPRFFPSFLGFSSENAAHRMAVEWDQHGKKHEGVYVPRRDTNSRLNNLVGGRLFPGFQHHAQLAVHENADQIAISVLSDDRQIDFSFEGRISTQIPKTSLFRSLEEASEFFRAGSVGYSPDQQKERFQGMELKCKNWCVEPLAVTKVRSSFFENPKIFPKGSIELDCALLMRNIDHEWHQKRALHAISGITHDTRK